VKGVRAEPETSAAISTFAGHNSQQGQSSLLACPANAFQLIVLKFDLLVR
jgi:hypothetical protein